MDLKQTRIERLKLFAKSRSVEDNPSALGELIGKKPNQVYNLLHGLSSFGEKVARSIEEAAGLPRDWLDSEGAKPPATVEAQKPRQLGAQWPFPKVPLERILALDAEDRGYVQRELLKAIQECEGGSDPVNPLTRSSAAPSSVETANYRKPHKGRKRA